MTDTLQKPTLNDAASANIETGVLLLCRELLVTAIGDKRLDRTHLKVLAFIAKHINGKTAKAWPGRQAIAAHLGVEVVTVSNKLRELRLWGYLIADRERVAEAGNRSLMVYTFGNVDHDTIRREINAYIDRIKNLPNEPKVTGGGDILSQKSLRTVTSADQKSLHQVTVTDDGGAPQPKVTEGGVRKSPSTVDSNARRESLPSNVEITNTHTSSSQVTTSLPPTAPALSEPKKKARAKKPRAKLVTLPRGEGFFLPKEWGEWTLARYVVTAAEIRREAERFKTNALAKGVKHKDWFAAWRTWCMSDYRKWRRRAAEEVSEHAPNLSGASPTATTEADEYRAAQAAVAAFDLGGVG